MAIGFGTAQPKTRSVSDKLEKRIARERLWLQVRRAVLKRDGQRCRVCQVKTDDVHHIRFRSRGGEDSTANCACLCRLHHNDIHAYRLALEGDADKTLKITRCAV